ncbi:LOW QUALITY PROTEIN: phospholipid phosphatase 1-like [Clytia hemisphaerica]
MKLAKVLLIFINVFVCLSFGFFVLMFNQLGQPFVRGFYCNDESINKPFKESTIPSTVIISCILGLACFLFAEFLNFVAPQPKESGSFGRRLCRVKKIVLGNLTITILCYAMGMGITMFITDIGKYSVGRLRPHFYDVCKPDWSKLNCTNTDGVENYFVGNDYCMDKENSWKFKDARLSFPSGHSSYSAFIATFLVLYLDRFVQLSNPLMHLPKFFIQTGLASAAIYCGFSRISDYKHHPTDVFVGLTIGFFVGLIVFFYILTGSCLPLLKLKEPISLSVNGDEPQSIKHYGTSGTTHPDELYQTSEINQQI